MFESDVSVEYKRQKDVSELRRKSVHPGKDVDKLAAELDSLKERASELQEEIDFEERQSCKHGLNNTD